MGEVKVRDAKPEDKEEVLSFCVGTFDWGDYIDEVYDLWLRAEGSRLLVAEDGGVPVGVLHLRLLAHQTAWLEGLRVRPSHRRSGVGTALTKEALDGLAKSGFRRVRLLIESNNDASQALASSIGFHEEGEWVFYHSKVPSKGFGPGKGRWATPATEGRVWAFLDSSELFNRGCRSYEDDWSLFPLESDDFARMAGSREIAFSGKGNDMAIAVVKRGSGRKRTAKACFLTGDEAGVSDLSAFLLSELAEEGIRRLHVSAPNHAAVAQGLKEAGFRAAPRVSLVYSRSI
jgi:GNAT superfamily N-acetyltransferase